MNKKVVSVLLSTVLAAGLAISAFAAPADSESVKKAADEVVSAGLVAVGLAVVSEVGMPLFSRKLLTHGNIAYGL